MKKFLSLVLALIMTMSLVTVSAGAADFTDASDITYEEAVEVMTAVGVVGGYADGSFAPEAGLTRGAAAKIICNMILGPTTAEALSADTAPASDVPVDHVFAGYIAYCMKEGIVSGYADGSFKPAAPLTGYAFMKMLLGALGYDAEIEGYVGANWSINVAKRALNIGLDDGLKTDFNGAKALTREEACLYAFNAMKATMVDYGNKTSITVGDIVVSTSAEAKEVTLGKTDILPEAVASQATLQFCEKYFAKLDVVSAKDQDAFGRPANTWKYDKDEIGTFVNDEPVVVYTEGFDADELSDLLKEYDIVASEKVYVNGELNCGGLTTIEALADREYTGNVIEIYTNDDDEINRIVVVQVYFAKMVTEEEDYVEVEIYNPWDTDSVIYEDNTKKDNDTFDKLSAAYDEDDYFLIYTNAAVTDEAVIDFADAESVSGVVETIKIDSTSTYNGYVTIDGTKYTFATAYTNAALKAGSEYTLYFDENGYVIGSVPVKEAAAAIEDVYYVDHIYAKESKVASQTVEKHYAQLVALDGTVSEIELEKVDKNNTSGTDSYVTNLSDFDGKLVTISDKKWVDDADATHKAGNEKYDLAIWYNAEYAADDDRAWDLYADKDLGNLKKTSTRVSDGSNTYRLNADTQYVFVESEKANIATKVVTGGVAFTWEDAKDNAIVITAHDTMVASYVIIVTDDYGLGQTYSKDAIFVASASSEKGDGYRVQKVYNADGSVDYLKVDESEYALSAGFYTYDTNADGFIVLEDATPMGSVSVWEDEEGAVSGEILADALFEGLLTIGTVEDIVVDEAVFVDAHDTTEFTAVGTPTGYYTKTVSSLEALCKLIDDGKVDNVMAYANVAKDGALIVVITAIDKV